LVLAINKRERITGDVIIIFNNVAGAMKGEKAVAAAGYETRLVAPPPHMRLGCDLALEINLVEQTGIERLLKEQDVPFKEVLPLTKEAVEICDVVRTTDFGRWYMVKAGNMKLSFEKVTGLIVNISGGGCPDIPYLNAEMVDKTLLTAPHPRDLGFTLCATMLQRAFEEAISLYQAGR
jgi:hypothetical protein